MRWQEPGVHVVPDEGVGDLEHDVHGDGGSDSRGMDRAATW